MKIIGVILIIVGVLAICFALPTLHNAFVMALMLLGQTYKAAVYVWWCFILTPIILFIGYLLVVIGNSIEETNRH